MKIVHIIFALQTGGTETMLVDIINSQTKYSQIHLIVINNEINQDIFNKIDNGVKVRLLNRAPGSRNIMPIIKLNMLLISIKPNVIHCHNHKATNLLFPIFQRVILTIHDTGISHQNFKKYTKIFAVSKAVADDVFKRSGLVATVIQNGVPTEKIKSKTEYSYRDFRIIQVSRLQHTKKGQHIALEALKLLHEKCNVNITLDLIGEGESSQYLRQLSNQLGLDRSVNFLGLKNRDYIYEHLKNYDLLIQPSIYEGFGLTIAEAMAAKVPVLVSNIEGPMEVIENGKYGLYFEKGNSYDAAAKIKIILSQTDEQRKLDAEKSYMYAFDKFNIANTAMQYLLNYKNLC